MAELLQQEAQNRPDGGPSVENVWTALQKVGVPVTGAQQHAARIFAARYCVGARAEPDLHFSVCEYADEKAAAVGREAARKAFESVPHREVLLTKRTILVMRQGTPTKDSEAHAAKVRAAFAKL